MFVVFVDQLLFVKVSSSNTKTWIHTYVSTFKNTKSSKMEINETYINPLKMKVHRVCIFTGQLHHLVFCHLVAIRIRTNKMAKGDKHLNKTSEQKANV